MSRRLFRIIISTTYVVVTCPECYESLFCSYDLFTFEKSSSSEPGENKDIKITFVRSGSAFTRCHDPRSAVTSYPASFTEQFAEYSRMILHGENITYDKNTLFVIFVTVCVICFKFFFRRENLTRNSSTNPRSLNALIYLNGEPRQNLTRTKV